MSTPFSTLVAAVGDRVRLTLLLSTDPGPVREFRPFLEAELDEAHASELLGHLALPLQDLRAQREAAIAAAGDSVVQLHPGRSDG